MKVHYVATSARIPVALDYERLEWDYWSEPPCLVVYMANDQRVRVPVADLTRVEREA